MMNIIGIFICVLLFACGFWMTCQADSGLVIFITAFLLCGFSTMYWMTPFSSEAISVEIAQDKLYNEYITLDKEEGVLRFTKVKKAENESSVIKVKKGVKIRTPHKTNKHKATLTYKQEYSMSKGKLPVNEVTIEIPKEK